jgi:lysophospholipase L1-like esterase
MSDNVPVTPGSGAIIATDDVGGVQFQRVKIALGGDGADGGTMLQPLTAAELAATQTLLPTGAATAANQATQNASLTVLETDALVSLATGVNLCPTQAEFFVNAGTTRTLDYGTGPLPGTRSVRWQFQNTPNNQGFSVDVGVEGRCDGANFVVSFWAKGSGSLSLVWASYSSGPAIDPEYTTVCTLDSTWRRYYFNGRCSQASAYQVLFQLYGSLVDMEVYGVQIECTENSVPSRYSDPLKRPTTSPYKWVCAPRPRTSVACWGDSLTGGAYGQNFRTELSRLLNFSTVYDGGVGGETSTQVKTRMIAATAKNRFGCVTIWVGRNNLTDPTTILADIETMVAALNHGRFLIIGVMNATNEPTGSLGHTNAVLIENTLLAKYGKRFLSVRKHFNAGVSDDTPSTTLMADLVHPNAVGYGLVASLIRDALRDAGFLTWMPQVSNKDDGQSTMANSAPVVIASDQTDVGTRLHGHTYDYAPGYDAVEDTTGEAAFDVAGNLITRAQTLTDEGGYRYNPAGSSLAVSLGTCTFTNGSDIVTGTGFDSVDVHMGDYVYLDADGVTQAKQVLFLTPTQLTLKSAYTGTGGTGASSRQYLKSVVGSGGTITVSNGQAVIAAQTTATSVFELERDVDVLPMVKQTQITISQRIANQDIYLGLYDENNGGTAKWYYWFHFTGTTNTAVNCVCGRNPSGAPTGGEIKTQAVTLPNGSTTAIAHRYRIEALKDRVSFYIDDVLVAQEFVQVPHPADFLTSTLRVVNGTTPATNTNITLDYDSTFNFNVLSAEYPSQTTAAAAPNMPLENFSYSQAGVITINTDLLVIDCRRFRSVAFQCTSMGTSGVVTIQCADDIAFTTPQTVTTFGIDGSAVATTFNAATIRFFNTYAPYIRFRLTTATTGGTTTIFAHGSHQLMQSWVATQPVSGSVTATVTSTRITPNAADGHSSNNHLISANSTNATSVKASAGSVGLIVVSNINAAVRYLKMYNKASAPTVGTDTPVMTIAVPPNQTVVIGGNSPIRFSTAAVAAAEMSISIFYT